MKQSLSIFLFFALISALYAANATCPAGFKLVNNKTCLRMFSNKLKHLEAEIDCSYFGGTLVTIKNAIDNRAVSNFAASAGASTVWIGMFCFASQNTSLCYHDDNSGALTYSNFAAGYPQIDQGLGGCVYMQTKGSSAGQWVSAPCEVIGMPFICQVPTTHPDKNCTRNYNGYCYMPSHQMQLTTINTTYDRAQSICQSKNADLVSIHSKPELDYVRAIYRNSGISQIQLGAQAFLPDTFDWADGSDWDYEYYDPLNTKSGSCLQMDLSERPNNGMWSEISCQTANYFLCKRKISTDPDPVVTSPPAEQMEERAANPRFVKKTPKKFDLSDFSNCNTTLLMSPGTITSFGYPSSKPPVTYCTWKVVALGPYRVGVYFTDFSVYGGVNIYDEYGGSISSPSGTMKPFGVLGATNIMRLTHDSRYDAMYQYHGFSATVLPY